MFREISPWHVILILAVFLLLFGYKKLPDATRSLGRSMRIFKSEIKGLHDDDPKHVESSSGSAAVAPAPERTTQPVDAPRAAEPRAESDRS
jgi:sec-independent protein translocase protein TatA